MPTPRTPILAVAALAVLTVALPAEARPGRMALELRGLKQARAMGRDLADARDHLDGLLFELRTPEQELRRARQARDEARDRYGAESPEALAQERTIADLRARVREIARKKIEPFLPRLDEVTEANRKRIQATVQAPGGVRRLVKSWLRKKRNDPAVLMLALNRATERLTAEAYLLYERALVGDIQDSLTSIRSTLDIVGNVVRADTGPDEYERAVDSLFSEGGNDPEAPVDDLERILNGS